MERNRRGRPRHPDVLTPAEWRVLKALREGGTNAEIAARLGLSLDTVKYHISNMLAKLELRDRRALASWRPEEPRGRLRGAFAISAAIGAVARPLLWVGAGTAAVAGVVVGVVAVVGLVAVVLVVAGGGGEPPLAVAPPPPQTSTPVPSPTTTSSPTATTTPTATPSPTSTATPTPTRTPSPAPSTVTTPTPNPTPSATSTPAPTATPGPTAVALPTREDLGIREVAAAEAFAAAGLTHVRYEAGEEVPWELGVYLLEVGTGAIEGWTCPEQRHQCPRLYLSPSNRFLSFSGYVHDRATNRTSLGFNAVTREPQHEGSLGELVGWGEGADERLLAWGSAGYVVLDSSMQPVALGGGLLGGSSSAQHGRYVAAQDGASLRLGDLESSSDPAAVQIIERPLPSDIQWQRIRALIHTGSDAVALRVPGDADSTRVIRYGWDGTLLSDVTIRRLSRHLNTSPSGNLVAGVTFEWV